MSINICCQNIPGPVKIRFVRKPNAVGADSLRSTMGRNSRAVSWVAGNLRGITTALRMPGRHDYDSFARAYTCQWGIESTSQWR